MAILFSDIYAKAIRLFDDPKITVAYETNKLQFAKIMYTYLNNAIGMFNNPASIGMRLADYNPPVGTMEVFEADGKTNTFRLDPDFEILDDEDKKTCLHMFIQGQIEVQGKLTKHVVQVLENKPQPKPEPDPEPEPPNDEIVEVPKDDEDDNNPDKPKLEEVWEDKIEKGGGGLVEIPKDDSDSDDNHKLEEVPKDDNTDSDDKLVEVPKDDNDQDQDQDPPQHEIVEVPREEVYYTVTFPDVLPEGQQYSFEQYYVGEFNDDFTKLNPLTKKGNGLILNEIKDILARLLVKAWAEEQRDVLLDIQNILQDSDFKISGNDRFLKSKNAWINQLDTEINQFQNKLAWNIRFMRGSTNIGRG